MKNLRLGEVDVPTYDFELHKNISFSSCMVMFMVHCRKWHGAIPFHYFYPWWGLSRGLLINPNRGHTQTLHPQEIHIPSYHFVVQTNFGILSFRVMFRVHHSQTNCVGPSPYCTSWRNNSNDILSDTNEDCMKALYPRKLTYKLTSLGMTKLFVFHILGSFLGYTISEGMM